MGTDRPRHRRQRQLTALAALALLGACAETPPPAPPDHIAIRMQVSGLFNERDVVFTRVADDRHRCWLPVRTDHPTAAGGTRRTVTSYAVVFGPDFPPGLRVSNEGPFPGAELYGPQRMFWIQFAALPGEENGSGPVRLSREFVIAASAGNGIFQRIVREEDLPRAGFVTIDPDLRGGRFRVRGLERQLHHNRAPENEVITVSGSWRCQAP